MFYVCPVAFVVVEGGLFQMLLEWVGVWVFVQEEKRRENHVQLGGNIQRFVEVVFGKSKNNKNKM